MDKPNLPSKEDQKRISRAERALGLQASQRHADAESRMCVREVLTGDGIDPTDFEQMVRGQIIQNGWLSGPGWACRRIEYDAPWYEGHLPLWPRTLSQPDEEDRVFHPRRTPPNELMCPLEQRFDRSVPCTEIQQRLAEEDDVDSESAAKDPARPFGALLKGDYLPCEIFHRQAKVFVRDHFEVKRPPQPHRAPLPSEGNAAALRQMRYLVDHGRIYLADLEEMLDTGVYVTDPRWLPCLHDGQRDQFDEYHDLPDEDEDEDEEGPPTKRCVEDQEGLEVPPGRKRCPLQVQALLGKRDVACIEAQVLHPGESLVRAAKKAMEGLEREDKEPKDPTFGTADDPVRRLGLRPCLLLGQILLHDVKDAVFRIQRDKSLLEADRRVLGLQQDESEPDSSWTVRGPRR